MRYVIIPSFISVAFSLVMLFIVKDLQNENAVLYSHVIKQDSVINIQNTELIKWSDSALRVRRHAGMKDDTVITWIDKVEHPVDTRSVTKWNPVDYWRCVDSTTGTWNKPSNYSHK